jgi:hypothetical protein
MCDGSRVRLSLRLIRRSVIEKLVHLSSDRASIEKQHDTRAELSHRLPLFKLRLLRTYLKGYALHMPSHELTKMLYSSLENMPNSILPRRHVRSCIEFECLPASPLDGESISNGKRAPDKNKGREVRLHSLRRSRSPSFASRLNAASAARARATRLARYADGQGRQLRPRELYDRHAAWLKEHRPIRSPPAYSRLR